MVAHLCIYGINSLHDLNCEVNRNLILVLTYVKLPPHALQSVSPKHQCVLLSLSLPTKQWKFLCVTHTIGRTFSGGSQLRCYVDGDLVSSEKCRYVKSSRLCCMICILWVNFIQSSDLSTYNNLQILSYSLITIAVVFLSTWGCSVSLGGRLDINNLDNNSSLLKTPHLRYYSTTNSIKVVISISSRMVIQEWYYC